MEQFWVALKILKGASDTNSFSVACKVSQSDTFADLLEKNAKLEANSIDKAQYFLDLVHPTPSLTLKVEKII